ncbi:MAG: zinc ribbon domain-containing protein [Acidimicrobiales bacterium]
MGDESVEASGNGQVARGDPLRSLLAVQDVDLAIDRLSYRRRELAERVAVMELDRRRDELNARRRAVETSRDSLSRAQASLEEHIASISSRIQTIEARIRQGSGSFRDVQSMSAEVDSLGRQRGALEDQELQIMEDLEPVEADVRAIGEELAAITLERGSAADALAAAESAIDAEQGQARSERAALVDGVPSGLLSTYEQLRQRLGGIGAARLVDGACGGCHLKLPLGERERLLHAAPGTVVYCEQCGRILVP